MCPEPAGSTVILRCTFSGASKPRRCRIHQLIQRVSVDIIHQHDQPLTSHPPPFTISPIISPGPLPGSATSVTGSRPPFVGRNDPSLSPPRVCWRRPLWGGPMGWWRLGSAVEVWCGQNLHFLGFSMLTIVNPSRFQSRQRKNHASWIITATYSITAITILCSTSKIHPLWCTTHRRNSAPQLHVVRCVDPWPPWTSEPAVGSSAGHLPRLRELEIWGSLGMSGSELTTGGHLRSILPGVRWPPVRSVFSEQGFFSKCVPQEASRSTESAKRCKKNSF